MLFIVCGKEAEKFGVNPVNDLLKIFRTVFELDPVDIQDKQFMLIILDPCLITFVKAGYIVDADALFIFTSPLLYLTDEIRDGASEIDEKVWWIHQRHHKVEEVGIILEIPCAHETHAMKVRGEYACILVYGTVLYDDVFIFGYIDNVLETLVQEIYLEVE